MSGELIYLFQHTNNNGSGGSSSNNNNSNKNIHGYMLTRSIHIKTNSASFIPWVGELLMCNDKREEREDLWL